MIITPEEGMLHISQWHREKTYILARHITNGQKNESHTMCYISAIDGHLTLFNEDDPGQFHADYTFDGATWLYLEIGETKDYLGYLGTIYRKDSPILVLGWPEMELLMLQPLPDELQMGVEET